jgi:hypothetical protein
MDPEVIIWIEILGKLIGGLVVGIGVLVAVFNYRKLAKIRRAEWLKSLFEKFFENDLYKEVRGWIDYDEVTEKLENDFVSKRANEEKFTDFLNFFEFIGLLYDRKELELDEINALFDYYLRKIKSNGKCAEWIDKFGFEKLRHLLSKLG